jgi:RNA polymerase sigma-70 factor (ECF subfamily)
MNDAIGAIEAIVPALRRYARGLLGSVQDADDLVHDALIQALGHMKPTMTAEELKPWLFVILRNRFISDRRKQALRRNVSIDDHETVLPAVRPTQDGTLTMRDLSAGLALLPDEQREVLLLVTLENFSYSEVATMLDIPLGTVMSRLSRARDRLHIHMDGKAKPTLRSVT